MERRSSSTVPYNPVTRGKSIGIGLACATIAFGGGMFAVRSRQTSAQKAEQPIPILSASAPATPATSAPAGSAEPPPVASAVASAASISEKPVRCPAEPKVEISPRTIPSSEQEIFTILLDTPHALGSASIGTPTRGFLFGGVELPESEAIQHAGGYAFGTELTIRSIERAVREVRRCFPNTPTLRVGDISRDKGGWLKPHRSHQSGLDADIGYYYRVPAGWYEKATAHNLDLPRTWALVRAFIEGGNVDTIFIDLTVQRILKAYVEKLPADEQPAEQWFQTPLKKDTAIRHAWGHLTHFHVRFRDPEAVALGNRIRDIVPRLRKAKPKKR